MLLSVVGRRVAVNLWCGKLSRFQSTSKRPVFSTQIRCSLSYRRGRMYFLEPGCTASSLIRAESIHSSSQRPKKRQPEEPSPPELDLIRYNLKDLKKVPKPALYLGFSGLIPFVSAPLFMAITETYIPELAYAQVVYGASIVSFLGGIRWGFALPEGSPAKPDWLNLANSVVPAIIAWGALFFSHNIMQSGILVILGLGISLHYDLSLLPTYPSWFKALRTILTAVAFFSLVSTILLKGLYPEKRYLSQA